MRSAGKNPLTWTQHTPKRKCVKAHMSESVLVRARLSVSGCSERRGAMRDRSDEKLGSREDL